MQSFKNEYAGLTVLRNSDCLLAHATLCPAASYLLFINYMRIRKRNGDNRSASDHRSPIPLKLAGGTRRTTEKSAVNLAVDSKEHKVVA